MDAKEIYKVGLSCLVRREHSTVELARKLRAKGFLSEPINQALQELSSQGYLSDLRFTENYARYRLNSGWGPVMIAQELLEKGVSQRLVQQHMATLEEGWALLAAQVRQKKFGAAMPQTFTEVIKQKRFLQYRGFTLDHIDQVFDKESVA